MNKQSLITILLAALMSIIGAKAYAHDIEAPNDDGVIIYYNWINNNTELAVTYQGSSYSSYNDDYSGNVVIPSTVVYQGTTYNVTFIGGDAYKDCSGLTSITIPNSVTSIGDNAFMGCSGLTSVAFGNGITSIGSCAFLNCSGLTSITIPNSVTFIDESAFSGCDGLTSVNISDIKSWCSISFNGGVANPLRQAKHLYLNGKEIKDLIIPNNVTSIGSYAFLGCCGLTSITIPNSVTSIGYGAFYGCDGLTSITIPNSVTSVSGCTFMECSGLTSVTIGNGVTTISGDAFANCTGLTSIIIPNNVTTISDLAFSGCSGLTSVTIPNCVNSIGSSAFAACSGMKSIIIGSGMRNIYSWAFANCSELTDVYCLAEKISFGSLGSNSEGIKTAYNAFKDSNFEYATLHVPAASLEDYKNIEPWKNFQNIVAIGDGEIPETPKCASPTVNLIDGKIQFSCVTEGVEYISEMTVSDAKKYYDADVSAPKKFKVSVYAVKTGYDNSDTVTAEFDFSSDTARSGDVDGDGKVNVADHVKLSEIIMNQHE